MQSSWTVKQPLGPFFKILITLFILVVVPLAAATIWMNWALNAPSEKGEEKIFVIGDGESTASFSTRLQEEGIIRNSLAFRLHLLFSGLDREIQAGSYRLPTDKPADEIAKTLTTGRLDKWVTFVEGLRKEEVAAILDEDFDINKKDFLKKAKEGYLFPDTYLIPINADENNVLSIFENNFEKKFAKTLLNDAKKAGLNEKQVITLASIVERETKNDEERPTIAGILIKRWHEEMKIAADATVQYVLGYSQEEKSWWRKNITEEDLNIDSPYNTRLNVGLPPGPICSPGLSSIEAVVKPTVTDYYFYLHDKDGNVHYAKTFEEHQENIAKYLQ